MKKILWILAIVLFSACQTSNQKDQHKERMAILKNLYLNLQIEKEDLN